ARLVVSDCRWHLARRQPQAFGGSLGSIMLHEQLPNETSTYVFDRQQQRSGVDAEICILSVGRGQTERIDESISTAVRIAPCERLAIATRQRLVFAKCGDIFGWSKHDCRAGRIWGHDPLLPIVFVVNIGSHF